MDTVDIILTVPAGYEDVARYAAQTAIAQGLASQQQVDAMAALQAQVDKGEATDAVAEFAAVVEQSQVQRQQPEPAIEPTPVIIAKQEVIQ